MQYVIIYSKKEPSSLNGISWLALEHKQPLRSREGESKSA